MSLGVPVSALLDYSDHERKKWRAWIAADASRLSVPVQTGGRFPDAFTLLDHVFLVERRHLSRLEGAVPPESTGVASGDWEALFEYADLVRADFRTYEREIDDEEAVERMTIAAASGTATMSRRRLITHVLLHEVRHLAQIAYAMRLAGHQPPGEHDLFYCGEFDEDGRA